jgi:hypothetical protein
MPALSVQRPGNEFIQALQSESLHDATNEQISQVLRLAMVMIGLRAQNWPNEEEKIILLSFIRAKYGRHKLAELRLAFELAVSGSLELGESGATCYENFSCEYVGRIMAAYRKWAEIQHKELPNEPPAGLLEYRMPRIDWAAEWEELQETAKNGNIDRVIIPTMLYDWLVENGILVLSGEDKKRFFLASRDSIIREILESGNLTYEQKKDLEILRSDEWYKNDLVKSKLQNKSKILAVKWLVCEG